MIAILKCATTAALALTGTSALAFASAGIVPPPPLSPGLPTATPPPPPTAPLSPVPEPAAFDPSGTWMLTATGRCFGSAAYSDGDTPLVGTDFACSSKLARFSPPTSDSITAAYDAITRTLTLSGGPSHTLRKLRLDREGFGASREAYRNETGPVDSGCDVHSYFTETVQFKEGHLTYAYVDNSEFLPSDDGGRDGCNPAITRLRGALSVGRASPGTVALLESGALDLTRFSGLRQTAIYYLYSGARQIQVSKTSK